MLTCSCTNLNIYLPALCWHPKQICIRERRLGLYLPLTDLILSDNRNPLLQTTRHIKWTLRISHIFSLTFNASTKSVEIACFGGHIVFTFTFMHLADAFTQSDLQLHSGYTFSLVSVFPGNRTHNLLRCWRNALPLSHTGTVFEVDDRKSTHRRQCGCPGFSISSCFLPSNSSLSFPSWTSHCSCFLGGGQSFFCCSSWCWREAFPHLNHVCEMLLYETIKYENSQLYLCICPVCKAIAFHCKSPRNLCMFIYLNVLRLRMLYGPLYWFFTLRKHMHLKSHVRSMV